MKSAFYHVLIVFSFLMVSLSASAQFRVVDAADGCPLEYVYVLNDKGEVLGMSDKDGIVSGYSGKVTLSYMSYESKTVDADTCRNDVRLKVFPHSLGEAVAENSDYIKYSTAFRDVFRCNDSIVLYREGLADYYYNVKKKSIKRRIRACRQYEHKDLRKAFGSCTNPWNTKSMDLSRIQHVDRDEAVVQSGDSIVYNTTFWGVKSGDAVIEIADTARHHFRSIIDMKKLRGAVAPLNTKVLQFLRVKWEKDVIDWTYSDSSHSYAALISCRRHRRIAFGKKNPTMEDTTRDVYMLSQETMDKEQAKLEMKDKTEIQDFTMPACVPPAPFNVEEQTKGLVLRDFWDKF